MSDTEIDQGTREWIEDVLACLDMVEWDRFVRGSAPDLGRYIEVYGWIERETDAYKDFIVIRFFPNTDDRIIGYTTSSDRYTTEIHRRIYGTGPDDHNPCQRVEHAFDIDNAIQLHDDASLGEFITDGGTSSTGTDHDGRTDGGEEPASPPRPAFYAELAYHRNAAAEQSNSLGVFEAPALIATGLVLSPIIAVAVIVGHCRTKRALRRAKTEGDDA